MNKLQQITTNSSLLIFCALFFVSAQALAETTTLNGVEISSSKDNGYEIVLNTDNDTKVDTKATSDNTLLLDLKNTKVSKNADTIYNNADGVEHVILKPAENNVQIEINGEDIADSKILLNDGTKTTEKNYNNIVFINKPLSSYAPVEEVEEEGINIDFIGILRAIKNSGTLRDVLHSSNIGWIFSFILMFGFLIISNLKNKARKPINVKLSANKQDKENLLLKAALERKQGLIGEMATETKRPQLRPMKRQPDLSAQKTNYGLKAYSNNSLGGSTNSFKIPNAPMPNNMLSMSSSGLKPFRGATATARELKEDIRKNEVRIDNVKFLESMAKIYEKSGRMDLVNGLNNNIKKAKSMR